MDLPTSSVVKNDDQPTNRTSDRYRIVLHRPHRTVPSADAVALVASRAPSVSAIKRLEASGSSSASTAFSASISVLH